MAKTELEEKLDTLALEYVQLGLDLIHIEGAGFIDSMHYAHTYALYKNKAKEIRRTADGVDTTG